jgi:hypothetical protein
MGYAMKDYTGGPPITSTCGDIERPMRLRPWIQVGDRASYTAICITWDAVDRSTLRTGIPLMRVTTSIAGGVHIALTAGQHGTHQVGESPADGTITANPRTPETPGNTGH